MASTPGIRVGPHVASSLAATRRQSVSAMLIAVAVGSLSLHACSDRHSRAPIDESGPPFRGGTLEMVGRSDLDHFATTSSYWSYPWGLFRTMTRQLLAYPPAADYEVATKAAPDLATEIPTTENGGISADGLMSFRTLAWMCGTRCWIRG